MNKQQDQVTSRNNWMVDNWNIYTYVPTFWNGCTTRTFVAAARTRMAQNQQDPTRSPVSWEMPFRSVTWSHLEFSLIASWLCSGHVTWSSNMVKRQTTWSSKKIEWHYCLCGLSGIATMRVHLLYYPISLCFMQNCLSDWLRGLTLIFPWLLLA